MSVPVRNCGKDVIFHLRLSHQRLWENESTSHQYLYITFNDDSTAFSSNFDCFSLFAHNASLISSNMSSSNSNSIQISSGFDYYQCIYSYYRNRYLSRGKSGKFYQIMYFICAAIIIEIPQWLNASNFFFDSPCHRPQSSFTFDRSINQC